MYPLLAGTKLVQHFNPLPFGFCRHPFAHLRRWQREHLIEKCSHVLQITWKTKRPVDRAGQADTHTHIHTCTPTTDPLETILYVQYHRPVSTDSSNNSPNVRSINVNKMDATAYPVARPICWIESDRKREREWVSETKNQTGQKKPLTNRNCIAKIVTKLCRWFMLLLLLFALCGPLFFCCVCFFFFPYWFSQMAACEN